MGIHDPTRSELEDVNGRQRDATIPCETHETVDAEGGISIRDVVSVAKTGYEVLSRLILHDGEASIARSRLYLAVNAALAALATFGGAASRPLAYVASSLAILCNAVWAATSTRSNTYTSLWFLELRRLERMLPPLRAFQSGYDVFRGKEVKGSDGHPVCMSKWADTLPVKSGYSWIAGLMVIAWVALVILLAIGVVDLSSPST